MCKVGLHPLEQIKNVRINVEKQITWPSLHLLDSPLQEVCIIYDPKDMAVSVWVRSTNKVFLVIFWILSALFLRKKLKFQEAFGYFSKNVLFQETSLKFENKATYNDWSLTFRN